MSKETFKIFARNHPELATQVINDKISWQKLYELYEIYGEDGSIWNNYLKLPENNNINNTPTTFKELISIIKNIDLDSVQTGVSNLQKTIGLLQDIGIGSTSSTQKANYEAKPLYQYFEDESGSIYNKLYKTKSNT